MLKTCCTRLLPALLMLLVACGPQTIGHHPIATQSDSLSYFVGVDIGRVYERHGLELDPALIYQGYQDVLDSATLSLDETEITRLALLISQRMKFAKEEMARAEAEQNRQKGEAFLRENEKKETVKKLASGLQYRIQEEGNGVPPTGDNEVRVSYVGRLIDGTVFASTLSESDSTSVVEIRRMLPGLADALLLMKPGARWEVYLPPHLGYGASGKDRVPPNTVLIFDLALEEIVR